MRFAWLPVLSCGLVMFGCSKGCEAPAVTARSDAASVDDATVAANNRAVALMGRFEFDQARQIFAELARRHPGHADIAVNLALATLNRQADGDLERSESLLSCTTRWALRHAGS